MQPLLHANIVTLQNQYQTNRIDESTDSEVRISRKKYSRFLYKQNTILTVCLCVCVKSDTSMRHCRNKTTHPARVYGVRVGAGIQQQPHKGRFALFGGPHQRRAMTLHTRNVCAKMRRINQQISIVIILGIRTQTSHYMHQRTIVAESVEKTAFLTTE
jgi:hypothetical protein